MTDDLTPGPEAALPVSNSDEPRRLGPEPPTPEPTQALPLQDLLALPSSASDEDLNERIHRYLDWAIRESPIRANYNLLFLYDFAPIGRVDADRIYEALSGADDTKPILLTIHSAGGDVASAYFIGKICREKTKASFEVAVPREAKSAATLICCSADLIHMGSLSELGPIDPQIKDMPALAVKHSLEHLSELVAQYPAARGMLADYIVRSLPIEVLGYYERAAGSAVQYAERLLGARRAVKSSVEHNAEIARKLVYEYKDHGFAIDAGEAITVFGDGVVSKNSTQYGLANQLYQELKFVSFVVEHRFKRGFAFTGALQGGSWVRKKAED